MLLDTYDEVIAVASGKRSDSQTVFCEIYLFMDGCPTISFTLHQGLTGPCPKGLTIHHRHRGFILRQGMFPLCLRWIVNLALECVLILIYFFS